jgi:hypothetical protein
MTLSVATASITFMLLVLYVNTALLIVKYNIVTGLLGVTLLCVNLLTVALENVILLSVLAPILGGAYCNYAARKLEGIQKPSTNYPWKSFETGRNLGRVFNCRCGCMDTTHLLLIIAKLSSLKLETCLTLDFALPELS